MARALSDYVRLRFRDPHYLERLDAPLLVWSAPVEQNDEQLLLGTASTAALARPTAREPLVFELRKCEKASNAFSMGITVGRTENNDVVVFDNSVSRFHAYFQQDRKTGQWMLVDAESLNGTWVGETRLEPSRPTPISGRATLRFGEVQMLFLSPDHFASHLEAQVSAG